MQRKFPHCMTLDVYKRQVLTNEENQFNKTIDQGLRILSDMEEEMKAKDEKTLSGENAFKLYDTYGFPLDLTKEILEEKGYGIDEEGFQAAMEEQRVKARTAQMCIRDRYNVDPDIGGAVCFVYHMDRL